MRKPRPIVGKLLGGLRWLVPALYIVFLLLPIKVTRTTRLSV